MAKNYLLIENSTLRKLSSFKFPPFTIFCCESKVGLDCLEPIVCNKTRFNFNVDFYGINFSARSCEKSYCSFNWIGLGYFISFQCSKKITNANTWEKLDRLKNSNWRWKKKLFFFKLIRYEINECLFMLCNMFVFVCHLSPDIPSYRGVLAKYKLSSSWTFIWNVMILLNSFFVLVRRKLF